MQIIELKHARLLKLNDSWRKYRYITSRNTWCGLLNTESNQRKKAHLKRLVRHINFFIYRDFPVALNDNHAHWKLKFVTGTCYLFLGTRKEIEKL